MITIIDYGMGNLRSVQKAFERLRIKAKISSDINEIMNSDKLVLPGVGHFERGVRNLNERKLFDPINEVVRRKQIPILGICLGMQLMTEYSEEGGVEGLGWIKAETKKFFFNENSLKIPHMGWNNLLIKKRKTLFNGIEHDNFFYFVHSYYITCQNEEDILTETTYGDRFVSSFNKDNIYGCQFHPEKSHDAGLLVLKNFSDL